jgi:hypothetical protein
LASSVGFKTITMLLAQLYRRSPGVIGLAILKRNPPALHTAHRTDNTTQSHGLLVCQSNLHSPPPPHQLKPPLSAHNMP